MAWPRAHAGAAVVVIEQMSLRDLGVIAEAVLPLGPGFTAVTGETGAGKTMVVTGLGLLLGARADSAAVRSGAEQASVEGVWTVPADGAVARRVQEAGGDMEPAGPGVAELYTARTVTAQGRSRATVGGRTAPAAVLAELAEHLVAMHGQSDQLRLRSGPAQRDALDRFGGDDIVAASGEYRRLFHDWTDLAAQVDALAAARADRAREADGLRAALSDIETADPQPGEDDALRVRAERLGNLEQLRLAAATARAALSDEDSDADVTALIAHARRELDNAAGLDPALGDYAGQAADIGYRAADLAATLSAYLADLDETGPQELEAVQDRRAVLAALARAHGSLQAAIDLMQTGSARLAELDDDPERLVRLTARRDDASAALDAAASVLTAARTDAATRLGAAITVELRSLAMPDARVEVAVTAAAASESGRDDVAFLLAPHAGAELRPVARTASGGELSRVMLAVEVVIAASDPVPTLVFDEVDAGIGGAAAIEVGRRLARLAASAQVIAVTHLAQVAAFAGNHLSVVKSSDGTVTSSSVRRLQGVDRETEMARLLSGTTSDAALTHARELLREAAR